MSCGGLQWALAPWFIASEAAILVLKEAWDLGINSIDTANGESERIIAQFTKKNYRFDPIIPIEETMKALYDLEQAGKFAVMNGVAGRNGWTRFVSMSDEYSLLYREEERGMHAYCVYNGIGVISWAPLSGGDLARPLGTSTVRSEGFKGTLYERHITDADYVIIHLSQVALSWVNNRRGGMSAVASPIVGVNLVERLREALAGGFELTDGKMGYLEGP
ncbi:Aldo keto reductase [Coniophora puteana RWD-64-598 SS2]|uniref:Aldo keto reductase n=1 Tax=Coniophora puteana (strain RWD-64-598) TaxID=741705 RepID=A0A5M3MUI4_CONPW|nr:Aldo keto reductase [Coniophora puteana RWD-64-598 SS2]EIW82766.1 Aldo keto reductase [Coniophora puteana RWD-64-598 SS2]